MKVERSEGQRASGPMFRLVQRLAGLGVWEWDVAPDRLTWSDELRRIFGQETNGAVPSFEAYLSLVHHEDRDRIASAIRKAVAGRTGFGFEERIVRPDGEVRVLETVGTVVGDGNGSPQRVVAACLDVTEKRELQRELAEAERARALGSLAAQVAHELNNPLTSVSASLQYLEHVLEAPRADVGHALRDLREGLDRVKETVRALPHHAHDPDVVRFATLGARPRPPTSVAPRTARYRVLVVDDDALVGRSLRRLLKPHDVLHVGSAAQALGVLEKDTAFDVLLCDLMMPGGTGPELSAVIRSRWPSLDERMVFITGGAFTKEAATFALAERHRVLLKPLDRRELLAALDAVATPGG